MCGFFGEYGPNLLEPTEFKRLLALSVHRGPDSTGVYKNDWSQLGFNRLAIQDLSPSGSQPKTSPSGKYTIVFNGEIYNHLQLRNHLGTKNFDSHGDSATICSALDEWGIIETISKLDGMFALAIFNHESKQISLVRDFAGIKPLHYGFKNNKLVFGSQYDQVLAHPLFKSASIQPAVLRLYLEQHHVPAPYGLHENMHQVLPGEIISFDQAGNINKERYWELPRFVEPSITDLKTATKHTEEALYKAVKDQLLSDVPLGGFLSGGVDSPLICSLANQDLNKPLDVFTIGSDSKEYDESELAQFFSDSIGTNMHLWKLDASSVLDHWDAAMASVHEPLADYSIIPTYLVSKLARKHVTVSLSGDGGDELFFGYERFWSVLKNIRFQHWPQLTRQLLYYSDRLWSYNKNVNSIILNEQGVGHRSIHSRFNKHLIESIFPDLSNQSPAPWNVYSYGDSRNITDVLNNMRYAEFYGMMQKTLKKVDLASMQNSLEVRVPFLQKSFIEESLKIAPQLNTLGNKKKEVLKHVLSLKIPSFQDDNKKRGFSIPLGKWINEDLRETFNDTLLSDNLSQFGMNKNACSKLLSQHKEGIRDNKWPLFTLYALAKYV